MSDTIMSVSDIIDAIFPDETRSCTINFRLLKTLLVIIANQLRVLNRHVLVNVDSGMKEPPNSMGPSLVVSEIKIQVDTEKVEERKQRKKKGGKAAERNKEQVVQKKQTKESKEKNVRENQNERQDEKRRFSKSMTQFNPNGSDKSGSVKEEETVLHESLALPKTTQDDLEEIREREIRTISQRADSHEDPALSPSPMASVHSLVSPQGRPPKINVVTKEQFEALADSVRELQAQFDPIGIPGFPENAEFLKALRRGASLTEAMAALQMSARLQAFEKAFPIMISLLTELARKTPGVEISRFQYLEKNFTQGSLVNENTMNCERERFKDSIGSNDWVSHEEFNNAMHELYEEVIGIVKTNNKPTGNNIKKTETLISEFERKVEAHNYEERIEYLEAEIGDYADKIATLEMSFVTQIGSYHEQLKQMQYQLETGMENMADKVAHIRNDPEALVELNVRLNALQQDAENAVFEQSNLKNFQNNMTLDLLSLWKEIELIRDAKADRDEVNDVLRDKAGIENLNGMVSVDQFNATRADLEAKINASYIKFSDQELVWQRALDDLTKSINEKGDWLHICTLRDDINIHLNNLRDKIDGLIEVVGEPRAAAVRKKLFRDTDCVCCGTPAVMNTELPDFKRASADGAEAPDMPRDDGDHKLCIPDHPVPRGHMCHRYCGGSHTLLPPQARAPPGITITQLPRIVTTTIGSDGKAYNTDEQQEMKPCGQCNFTKDSSQLTPDDIDNSPPSKKDIESAHAERNASSFDIMEDFSRLVAPRYNSGNDYPSLPLFDDDD